MLNRELCRGAWAAREKEKKIQAKIHHGITKPWPTLKQD
jgi:hypothetical protein